MPINYPKSVPKHLKEKLFCLARLSRVGVMINLLVVAMPFRHNIYEYERTKVKVEIML